MNSALAEPLKTALVLPRLRLSWSAAVYLLILAAAVLNTLYLFVSPLDLSPDEAHYWDWSRHLAWSYYSKGPFVAWLIRGSCELFGNTVFAVRLPAVLCSTLMLVALDRLARRTLGSAKLSFWLVAVVLTLPPISAGAVLTTIDAPFLCCWSWALVFVHRAIFENDDRSWTRAGIVLAVGTLTKYTMLAFPVLIGLFLIVDHSRRPTLFGCGFRRMTFLGCLGLIPILVWNATHDWLGLWHLFGQAGLATGPKIGFKWYGLLDYLGGQFAFLVGYWFCVWLAAAWTFRPGREANPHFAFLWWLSVPLVLMMLPFSLRVKVQPNWPATAYLPGIVLAVAWLRRQFEGESKIYRRLVIACLALGILASLTLTIVARFPRLALPLFAKLAAEPTDDQLAPVRNLDPTARLRGWRYLAGEVDKLRDLVRSEDGQESLTGAMVWTLPGELGFYCEGNPQVYTFGVALSDRFSQYDVWRPNPVADAQAFCGRTFVYVGEKMPDMNAVFERCDGPYRVEYRENGVTVGGWKLWIARGYRGFPTSHKLSQY
ncbi:ArnT family glycosyltransferase [Limnoglobus roseus]|uniref:GT83 family glycosyltransferase n=1 Tax=Limnoglobus roseus TaxID=2598579 RepID=A0A5C1AAJ8_9BACT|nr:glycosyltransferase family 39 protein [Limnoglobus roseus]QEL15247.1 GT83 family glycosyltransferase [Limnoglobus roseus]